MNWIIIISILVVACLGLAIIYGRSRWQSDTLVLRTKLVERRKTIKPQTYDSQEIVDLPTPVQRFFHKVLKDGQSMVAAVNLSQEGQFNFDEMSDKWNPFTATQFFVTKQLGFDWDAKIQMAPGLSAFVHDTYLAGAGNLHASFLGLFTLANMHGTPELNQGELLRFLAEAAWYPTALLPSQGVRWEAIDDTSARGTLTDGDTTASLVFGFNPEGTIATIYAAARYRDKLTAMPWGGKFSEYTVREGMLIPLVGEVGWMHPEGLRLYFQGKITEVNYEFAG
jgi:hypothetical protein